MPVLPKLRTVVLALLLALPAASCATMPDDLEERAEIEALNDPFEPANRAIYDVNTALDDAVMAPLAEYYRDQMPDWGREAIHNILNNLQEPFIAGNDMLQGNFRAAGLSLLRFVINTTVGLGGLQDRAANGGDLPGHKTDLGVTLAVWGVEEGPYLMVPLVGPGNLRDGAARVGEYWADPVGAVTGSYGLDLFGPVQSGVGMLDGRAALIDPLNEIRRTSLDEYAAIRSLYRQNRAAMIEAARQGHRPKPSAVPSSASSPARPASPAASGSTPVSASAPTRPAATPPSAPPPWLVPAPAGIEFVDPSER